jgi:hypothetical protein
MTKWEHCVLEWQPHQCTLTVYGQGAQVFPITDWESVFMQLGEDGWELVSTLASPTGIHEYWYYFKRPVVS